MSRLNALPHIDPDRCTGYTVCVQCAYLPPMQYEQRRQAARRSEIQGQAQFGIGRLATRLRPANLAW